MLLVPKQNARFLIRNNNVRRIVAQRHMPCQNRSLSIWTIPKLVLAYRGRGAVLGALGATTLLSSFVGPVVWVAVGGAASIFSWRIYRKAKSWWNYLAPTNHPLSSALLSHISSHKASEEVRSKTIEQLSKYFGSTGKDLLKAFDLSHPNQLVWDQVHKSEMIKEDDQHYRVNIYFWLEDGISERPKGGGCEVVASALVENATGNVQVKQIKLSSPGWHKDEIINLS